MLVRSSFPLCSSTVNLLSQSLSLLTNKSACFSLMHREAHEQINRIIRSIRWEPEGCVWRCRKSARECFRFPEQWPSPWMRWRWLWRCHLHHEYITNRLVNSASKYQLSMPQNSRLGQNATTHALGGLIFHWIHWVKFHLYLCSDTFCSWGISPMIETSEYLHRPLYRTWWATWGMRLRWLGLWLVRR